MSRPFCTPSGPHRRELHGSGHGCCERMWLRLIKRHPLLGGLCLEQCEPVLSPDLVGHSCPGTHAAPRYREDCIRRPRFRWRRAELPIRPLARGLPVRMVPRRSKLVCRGSCGILCRGGAAVEPRHLPERNLSTRWWTAILHRFIPWLPRSR